MPFDVRHLSLTIDVLDMHGFMCVASGHGQRYTAVDTANAIIATTSTRMSDHTTCGGLSVLITKLPHTFVPALAATMESRLMLSTSVVCWPNVWLVVRVWFVFGCVGVGYRLVVWHWWAG